jgi:heme/copper-type cytochrome/quinol oxidase subunit 3
VFIIRSRMGAQRRRVTLEVTAWYWHSMAVLWILIFGLLKIAD